MQADTHSGTFETDWQNYKIFHKSMSTYTAARRSRRRRRSTKITPILLFQAVLALAGGLVLFVLILGAVLGVSGMRYAGRIYPGISVGGVDLSGLTQEAAVERLTSTLSYPTTGRIIFRFGDKLWTATPAELGLALDAQTSAQAAYNLGRNGGLLARLDTRLNAWHSRKDLSPLVIYDERIAYQYLNQIATQVNLPKIEASLQVNGVEVVAVPGQVGRQVDIQANLAALEKPMRSLTDGMLPLVVAEIPPEVLDASQQAEVARKILSAPLSLQIPDAAEDESAPYVIDRERLARMITIAKAPTQNGTQFQVGLDSAALTTYLEALAPNIARYPQNTRFMFNDDTSLLEVIQPAVIGRSLDVPATAQEINQKLPQGEHNIALKVNYTKPQITDDSTGEQLGITELVYAYTSYFRGSTAERLNNIELSAANFHGLLVPPYTTFSMAENMGEVSLDNGYAEAWIIFGGQTIKGVGGGVCQVSTTFFRTAFFAGYPIIERHPHAYRVGYYEQTSGGWDADLAGLDATVFVPVVDFKFKNDTPYWLLMETYFRPNSRSLTWKFYSTKDGREVQWDTTGPQNIVDPPEPIYEENPELAAGEINQVDWAAEGADVTVTRTVTRGGIVIDSDVITTHYLPWADRYQYGPGTELPTDKKKKRRGFEGLFLYLN